LEVAQFIRDHHTRLPVIVISGYPDLADRIRAANLGGVVQMVLTKPVDTAALLGYFSGAACFRSTGSAPPELSV
jgi:CheY-like chemotaxis protein